MSIISSNTAKYATEIVYMQRWKKALMYYNILLITQGMYLTKVYFYIVI